MDKVINKEKYQNLILYFIKNCNNEHLGSTKLYKLLYYADFLSYRDFGESITGDVYIKKTYGPVAQKGRDMLGALSKAGKLKVIDSGYKNKQSYEISSDLDMSVFSSNEEKLLKKICKEFESYTTNEIVTQTHFEAPWFYGKDEKPVDYEYAYSIEVLS